MIDDRPHVATDDTDRLVEAGYDGRHRHFLATAYEWQMVNNASEFSPDFAALRAGFRFDGRNTDFADYLKTMVGGEYLFQYANGTACLTPKGIEVAKSL